MQAGPLQVAAQHVVHERGAAVAEVGRAVHRGTAQVDAHRAGLAEGELTYLPGRRVVQVQHGPPASRVGCRQPPNEFAGEVEGGDCADHDRRR